MLKEEIKPVYRNMFPYKAGKCGRRQTYTAGIRVCTMYTVNDEGLSLADDNVSRNFLFGMRNVQHST